VNYSVALRTGNRFLSIRAVPLPNRGIVYSGIVKRAQTARGQTRSLRRSPIQQEPRGLFNKQRGTFLLSVSSSLVIQPRQ